MTEPIDWNELCAETIADFRMTALPTTLQLPALPVAVHQFLEKSQDPDASSKELSRLIETDAGMALEVFRHVNGVCLPLAKRQAANLSRGRESAGQCDRV